jgi:hypothetical protein
MRFSIEEETDGEQDPAFDTKEQTGFGEHLKS